MKYIIILLISSNFLSAVQSQNSTISLEYFPHISSLSYQSDQTYTPKFSHNISARIDFPISESTAFHARLGFTSAGYKVINDNPMPPISGGVTFFNVDFVITANIFEASIGTKFTRNNYFLITEAGLGISMSNSLKFIERGNDGSQSTTKNKTKAEDLKPDFIPLTLSIGRNISLYNTSFNVGLRGYYSFSKSGLNAGDNAALYGFGLFVGIAFD